MPAPSKLRNSDAGAGGRAGPGGIPAKGHRGVIDAQAGAERSGPVRAFVQHQLRALPSADKIDVAGPLLAQIHNRWFEQPHRQQAVIGA